MALLWMTIKAFLLTRREITLRGPQRVVKLLAPFGEQTETPTPAGSSAASCHSDCCCRETQQQLCAASLLHCLSLSLRHHQHAVPFSFAPLVLCNSNHLIGLITCWARDLTSKPAAGHQLWHCHDTYIQEKEASGCVCVWVSARVCVTAPCAQGGQCLR